LKRTALVVLFTLSTTIFAAAQAGTLKGLVSNGTTRKPAPGDEVVLVKLDQGMQEEARTKTNAGGEFSFKLADTRIPRLVRVNHQSVNYFEQVPPGTQSVQITVYNAAAKVPDVKVMDQSEVYEAKGDAVRVIELFRLRNTSRPPMTQPSFEFYLPEGASIQLGQAVSGGIPVKTPPIPAKEKNKYQFLFPIRPGVTQFELVYTLKSAGALQVKPKFSSVADSFYVVMPKSITFTASDPAAFKPIPQWPVDASITGANVYVAENFKQDLGFSISGQGLLPDTDSANGAPQQGGPEPRGNTNPAPGGGLGTPNDRPDPLHSGQWLFLGVLSLFLAAGGVYVFTSNSPAAAPASGPAPAAGKSQKAQPARQDKLLEAMKEEMFQLETDRLQGKISQPDYESAKAALDKTLQRAVQRQKAAK
jgi:hypothetical protein